MPTTPIRYPDVSHYQTITSWDELIAYLKATYGIAIVGIKATQSSHVDPKFHANQAGARAAGADVIIYYDYLQAAADPAASARFLVATVGTWQPGEVACCDLEEGAGDQSSRLDAWNTAIHEPELDYSGDSMWRHQLANARTALHRWDAAYRSTDPGLMNEIAWQDRDNGTFPGIAGSCDESIVHGDPDQFRSALGLTTPPATSPGALSMLDPEVKQQFDTLTTNDANLGRGIVQIAGALNALAKQLSDDQAADLIEINDLKTLLATNTPTHGS